LFDATPSSRMAWYQATKAVLDWIVAFTLLVLTLPLLLGAMALVALTSPGGAIYSQVRIGKNGRPFRIYKIRTMVADSEANGAQWSLPGDARITRVGKWLRRTHLDELPQLWNVLLGDMSLIGPRPERPEFVPGLALDIPLYRDRHRVRPGVTGFAQVQLPADTDISSVRVKTAYDLYYVDNIGFWFDFRIYAATFLKMLGVGFPRIGTLFQFPRRERIEQGYSARCEQLAPAHAS
jgi:lipopolysaccharide/colanic/teichoic acid biosynthesis glycosyltransferase